MLPSERLLPGAYYLADIATGAVAMATVTPAGLLSVYTGGAWSETRAIDEVTRRLLSGSPQTARQAAVREAHRIA